MLRNPIRKLHLFHRKLSQLNVRSSSAEAFVSPSERVVLKYGFAAAAVASFIMVGTVKSEVTLLETAPNASKISDNDEEATTVLNWSGTHSVNVPGDHYYEPESVQELESIVAKCNKKGLPIRPVGSALSPNGISFQSKGMVSLANLDRVVKVDRKNMTVTVEAGARVSQVIDELRKYGLTLPNLASIAEQQMGGFTQIGAHGTGAKIAPVDHYVTSIKLVTPSKGTVELTEADGENFQLAKVGLGCLGVVSEVTMKCIPAHNLLEHTYVLSRAQAKEQLNDLLKRHRHVRYMWIPFTDSVVVVTNDPEDESSSKLVQDTKSNGEDNVRIFRDLLKELSKGQKDPHTDETLEGQGFGELRDALLAFDPLNGDHVKLINSAEAQFWKKSEGYQIRPSDELLQFDCGGQQWVFETCFPTGTYEKNNGNDMKFMEELLQRIESEKIPAHAPIEQRWSASSSSSMSPAHGSPGGLHCWVGIIMYLPSDDESERREITNRFKGQYCDLSREVGKAYGTVSHWGKLEMPISLEDNVKLQELMNSRYPADKFKAARKLYDPKNILGNDLMDLIF